MGKSLTVFDKTYEGYLARLRGCDYLGRAGRLGAAVRDDALVVPFLNERFFVSPMGLVGPAGAVPGFSESIVLLNYILRCPERLPVGGEWISYREVKGSGPLGVYFSDNAVKPLANRFAGKLSELSVACRKLGGRETPGAGAYDVSATFTLLPRIPLSLRFNDADEAFPASCTLLFASDVSSWLDPESLAILAVLFARKMVNSEQ